MGYILIIGEAEIDYNQEDLYVSLTAKGVNNKDAPAFGEPTDFTNSRWPSYTSWHDALVFCGLDRFYNEDDELCLIQDHPGCTPISIKHKEYIDIQYDTYKNKYPKAKAGYSPKVQKDNFVTDDEWPEENNCMTRIEWLKYWIDWSLTNCKKPVFANS